MYLALSEQVLEKTILGLKLGGGFAAFTNTQCYPPLWSFSEGGILAL